MEPLDPFTVVGRVVGTSENGAPLVELFRDRDSITISEDGSKNHFFTFSMLCDPDLIWKVRVNE